MTYIENVFACIAAPLLVAALCAGKKQLRPFIFSLAGMLACLLSAYVNTFFAAMLDATALDATAEIAPVVEEVMKFLPLLFFLLCCLQALFHLNGMGFDIPAQLDGMPQLFELLCEDADLRGIWLITVELLALF